jgi:hypothetical protein
MLNTAQPPIQPADWRPPVCAGCPAAHDSRVGLTPRHILIVHEPSHAWRTNGRNRQLVRPQLRPVERCSEGQPNGAPCRASTPYGRLWVITLESFRLAKEVPRWPRREAQQDTRATTRQPATLSARWRAVPDESETQRNPGVGTLPSGGAADGSGEVALNRAARVVDGMHVDVVHNETIVALAFMGTPRWTLPSASSTQYSL